MDIEIKISDDGFQAKYRLTNISCSGPEPYVGVCISMGMIVYMCMSICMYMSAFSIKLIDVLMIYLINIIIHGFVFTSYTPLSTY